MEFEILSGDKEEILFEGSNIGFCRFSAMVGDFLGFGEDYRHARCSTRDKQAWPNFFDKVKQGRQSTESKKRKRETQGNTLQNKEVEVFAKIFFRPRQCDLRGKWSVEECKIMLPVFKLLNAHLEEELLKESKKTKKSKVKSEELTEEERHEAEIREYYHLTRPACLSRTFSDNVAIFLKGLEYCVKKKEVAILDTQCVFKDLILTYKW